MSDSRAGEGVNVCFNSDTSKLIRGLIIRDDDKITLIKLFDGRYVSGGECQYQFSTMTALEKTNIFSAGLRELINA